jgi:hypothetical protein
VYSILSQNGTLEPARVTTRFVIGLQCALFHMNPICAGRGLWEAGSMEEAGSGHEDSVTTY